MWCREFISLYQAQYNITNWQFLRYTVKSFVLTVMHSVFPESDVMSKYCCKFLEISRPPSYADMCIIELPGTFHQIMQLLRNSTEIVLM